MKAKDIEVDAEYAILRYGTLTSKKIYRDRGTEFDGRRIDIDLLASQVWRATVLEKNVERHANTRPYRRSTDGIRVRLEERHGSGSTFDKDEEQVLLGVQIVMPWSDWDVLYHTTLQAREEAEEVRRAEAVKRAAEEKERSAKLWMEREFNQATCDLENVMEVLGFMLDDVNYHGTFEDAARSLVEHRNPDGNPYLHDDN